jgi:hypothetical protein
MRFNEGGQSDIGVLLSHCCRWLAGTLTVGPAEQGATPPQLRATDFKSTPAVLFTDPAWSQPSLHGREGEAANGRFVEAKSI